jgi:RNA polymerase sigma-70 factor (ECF subfamily)
VERAKIDRRLPPPAVRVRVRVEDNGRDHEVLTLVDAARGGDRDAFGRLHARYARMVHGILLARARRVDLDDLVQDVFLQALRQLHTLRDSATFGSWLAMIARHRASVHQVAGPRLWQHGRAGRQ